MNKPSRKSPKYSYAVEITLTRYEMSAAVPADTATLVESTTFGAQRQKSKAVTQYRNAVAGVRHKPVGIGHGIGIDDK